MNQCPDSASSHDETPLLGNARRSVICESFRKRDFLLGRLNSFPSMQVPSIGASESSPSHAALNPTSYDTSILQSVPAAAQFVLHGSNAPAPVPASVLLEAIPLVNISLAETFLRRRFFASLRGPKIQIRT